MMGSLIVICRACHQPAGPALDAFGNTIYTCYRCGWRWPLVTAEAVGMVFVRNRTGADPQ